MRTRVALPVMTAACLAATALLTAQAPPPAAPARPQAAPRYRVDPFWPKPLPNKWSMQQIVDIYVDRFDQFGNFAGTVKVCRY